MISSFVRALVSAFKARRELALEKVEIREGRAAQTISLCFAVAL